MPVLRVRKGKNEGEAYAVFSRKLPTVLGRGEDAEICLDDNRSSRKHAQVLLAWGNWLLQDLDSSNGTLLNSEKVDKARLPDQATIQVGNTLLVFEENEDLPAPRREIYGSRLLETTREESGIFVYNAYQAALDRPVRIDLFAPGQAPTGDLLDTVTAAVEAASALKHDLIDGVITADFSDNSKSYLVLRSRGGSTLEDELDSIQASALSTRLNLVRQLLLITIERCLIPVTCCPLSLCQLHVQPEADGEKSLSAAAVELPTLVSTRNGSLCHLPAYTDYLPPELSEEENREGAMMDKALAYSAAAVSYFLLTGAPAMGDGETREILKRHRELKPAPANLINSDIPEDLSNLLSEMLEKEPGGRPSTAEILDPVLSGMESNRDVIEIKGNFEAEGGPKDIKADEKPVAPVPVTTPPPTRPEPITGIPRSRLERDSRPSLLGNLATLPLWAILWGILFLGCWKASYHLFAIFMP